MLDAAEVPMPFIGVGIWSFSNSLRLCKQHEQPQAAIGFDSETLFGGALRDSETVAGFIVSRFPIDQEHVMVRLVCRNMMQGDMPAADRAVMEQWDFLPVSKRADYFDGGRKLRLAVRWTPA